jgi:hypothetical protein
LSAEYSENILQGEKPVIDRPIAEPERQLPLGGEIFLDHVGHFVADPEAASAALARAGFAPTPPSVQVNPNPAGGQPQLTGTGNITAMLARGYIEVLFRTADTPLGRELEVSRARYPGIHLAAFAVADAGAAHRRLAAAEFRVRPLVDMQRPAATEEGTGTAAFTIARVEPDVMPEGRMQILTHRTEHTVWQPRWLTHPNSASALLDLVIAVSDVEEAARRFSRFTDRRALPSAFGASIGLDRGRLELMHADALLRLLPELRIPDLPFAAACGIRVRSLETAADALRRGDVGFERSGEALIVPFPPALGVGAWLFVERPGGLIWRQG